MKYNGTIVTDLSGSMAGITASRNAGGSYLKGKSNPTQPNTAAQSAAKSAFGSASSAYASLTAVLKSQWRNFAQNNYTPKGGTLDGVATGQQAFTAISTTFDSSVRLMRPVTLLLDAAPPTTGAAFATYTPPYANPPVSPHSAQLMDYVGNVNPIDILDATLDEAGTFGAEFQVGDGSAVGYEFFMNPYNVECGLMFMMSNANTQPNQSYSNPQNNIICMTDVLGWTQTTPPDASFGEFSIETTDVFDPSRFQRWPSAGNYVLITAYLVSKNCQLAVIGSKEIQVTV